MRKLAKLPREKSTRCNRRLLVIWNDGLSQVKPKTSLCIPVSTRDLLVGYDVADISRYRYYSDGNCHRTRAATLSSGYNTAPDMNRSSEVANIRGRRVLPVSEPGGVSHRISRSETSQVRFGVITRRARVLTMRFPHRRVSQTWPTETTTMTMRLRIRTHARSDPAQRPE